MRRKVYYGNILLIAYALISLLILKPAILTSSIANQRGINSGANTDALTKLANANVVSPFGNDNFSQLSVKDWASLLSQTNDPTFFAGKEAGFTGFVAPDQQGSDGHFYASRFIISCCAVDARPIGVPIRQPDWQKEFKADQWVEVKGVFKIKDGRAAVEPTSIKAIDRPKDPYVY